MSVAIALALSSLTIVTAVWLVYMLSIPRHAVPEKPVVHVVLQGLALSLSLGALLKSGIDGQEIVATGAIALPAMGFAAFFFWLLANRKTPIGEIKVAPGDPILPFESVTSEGTSFDSSTLRGERVLLKFFRGGW